MWTPADGGLFGVQAEMIMTAGLKWKTTLFRPKNSASRYPSLLLGTGLELHQYFSKAENLMPGFLCWFWAGGDECICVGLFFLVFVLVLFSLIGLSMVWLYYISSMNMIIGHPCDFPYCQNAVLNIWFIIKNLFFYWLIVWSIWFLPTLRYN